MNLRIYEQACYIYWLGADLPTVKIGHTNEPERRLAEFRRETGTPGHKAAFAAVIWLDRCRERVEREAHRRAAAFRRDGEWFALTAAEALQYVIDAAEALGVRYEVEDRADLLPATVAAREHAEKVRLCAMLPDSVEAPLPDSLLLSGTYTGDHRLTLPLETLRRLAEAHLAERAEHAEKVRLIAMLPERVGFTTHAYHLHLPDNVVIVHSDNHERKLEVYDYSKAFWLRRYPEGQLVSIGEVPRFTRGEDRFDLPVEMLRELVAKHERAARVRAAQEQAERAAAAERAAREFAINTAKREEADRKANFWFLGGLATIFLAGLMMVK